LSCKYIIATDLGSQSIKTAIYDIEGRLLGSTTKATIIRKLGPGALVYSGDDFYSGTVENIRNVVEISGIEPKDIASLVFTGMGGGIIGVDENWNPTMEYTNPLDSRDQPYFIEIMSEHSDLIRQKSGTGSPMGANKILWVKNEHPDIYKSTKKFMMVTQYIQGKLIGSIHKEAFWEKTSVPLSGLTDAANNIWSEDICKSLSIDIDKLPRIIPSTEIIGSLKKEPARVCGLMEGIPVIAGAYDKPCDLLGSGSNVVGNIVDNAATYPALTACVDRFKADMKYKTLECSPSAIQGKWIAMTYIVGGGLTHRWFRDEFCSIDNDKLNNVKDTIYRDLDKKASLIPPGSEGILFIPHLSGRATPSDPEVRGAWAGFTWTHKREHFYRSILEAIAYDHACSLDAIKENYPHISFKQVIVIGGGAESSLWNQIKANVLGLKYLKLAREDTTTLGAAIIGGKAVGIFDDMKETSDKFVNIEDVKHPSIDRHNIYRSYVNSYKKIFKDLKPVYERLSDLRKQIYDAII